MHPDTCCIIHNGTVMGMSQPSWSAGAGAGTPDVADILREEVLSTLKANCCNSSKQEARKVARRLREGGD